MSHIILETYRFTPNPDDPDNTFRCDVAFYSGIDPMPTIEGMSGQFEIPSGAIAKYVLAKWATSGSDGLLEIGPGVVRQMARLAREAELEMNETKKAQAYQRIGKIISWLEAGLPKDDGN